MTLVATATVGSGGAANMQFLSIPQTGTDLILVVSARTTAASDGNLTISATGHTGVQRRTLLGSGSTTTSTNTTGNMDVPVVVGTGTTANTFCSVQYYIPNYTSTTVKSLSIDGVGENNATTSNQVIISARIGTSAAAAMTEITLTNSTGNFAEHSTASLYIVTKGSGGATTSP
jgi:hypothetical protein